MPTHPLNRPHRVDSSTAQFLFGLYSYLFAANVSLRIKQRTFETAAESRDMWRVVSISRAALECIALNKTAKGLQRGHILSRNDRALHMFKRDQPLTQAELLGYFFEHDTVALITKAENSRDGTAHWSPLLAVPEGIFTAGSFFSIYVRKSKDLPWVVQELRSPPSTAYTTSEPDKSNGDFKKLHRIELWAHRPTQVNHKIIRAFLDLEKNGDVHLPELREHCKREHDIVKFDDNYAGMKTDEGHSHGKVFYDDGDVVKMFSIVRRKVDQHFQGGV